MTEIDMKHPKSWFRRTMKETSKSIVRSVNRKTNARGIQKEAASRPESVHVPTPTGDVWMSPIGVELYEALQREGLSPTPQFCIEGYFVDCAFPDVRVAVEADGAAYHQGEDRRRDWKRDQTLERNG